MKLSKELKAGIITLLAIGLLVAGINFLKGNSFFGGDDQYEAYFPNSGNLAPATSVYVNGVAIGKVLTVEYQPHGDSLSKVKVTFNIQDDNVQIPRGSKVEIGSVDFLNKGILLTLNSDLSKGYYKPGDKIQGSVESDMISQVKAYADPTIQKLQSLISTVDRTVTSINAFWDTTATSKIEASMNEVQIAIKRFGNVAIEVEDLVASEKAKFGRIMSNVESISANLKASNDKISGIIGNTKKITDDLVTVNYKSVVEDAQKTIQKLNGLLEDASNGEGTLGKLLHDEKLYNELVNTNKELQELVDDITVHPERYIHFSVLGAKTKGVPLTPREEKKLRNFLDTIPD
ncbi:MAG TPA: MlaD family protein [Fluviicola sp.]|nr:MlaD family protein [Fluviicola sp.]